MFRCTWTRCTHKAACASSATWPPFFMYPSWRLICSHSFTLIAHSYIPNVLVAQASSAFLRVNLSTWSMLIFSSRIFCIQKIVGVSHANKACGRDWRADFCWNSTFSVFHNMWIYRVYAHVFAYMRKCLYTRRLRFLYDVNDDLVV